MNLPTQLEGAARKSSVKYPFKPEKFIPKITEELGIAPKAQAFDQKAVRRMQEIAYTRYLGLQTRGGSKAAALYALESPGRVYEKVAIWLALQYPMNRTTLAQ
jgi:thiaminase